MPITYISRSDSNTDSVARKLKSSKGHCKPLPITTDLTQPGRLRVGHCLTLYAVSHSSFYRGLGERYPKPDGHDGRPYWNTATIREHLNAVH